MRNIFWWLTTPLVVCTLVYLAYSRHLINKRFEHLRKQFAVQRLELAHLRDRLMETKMERDLSWDAESLCRGEKAFLQQRLQICKDAMQRQRRTFGILSQQPVADANGNETAQAGDLLEDIRNAEQQYNQQQQSQSANGYPKLTPNGDFIPEHLWVHFDLKGAPLRPSYFVALLPFLKKMGINGLLIEWEDMFPYTGRLAAARNGNAYSLNDVEQMLQTAVGLGMEVVPLVQTFGHLEWVLKVQEFAHLREDMKYPQVICFGSDQAWTLITEMVSQVAEVHTRFGLNYFHIGADEAFHVGVCNGTVQMIRAHGGSKENAILWHISRTAAFVKKKFSATVLAWHDMFARMPEANLKAYNLTEVLEPVLWAYPENLDAYSPFAGWISSLRPFKNVWGASAFKGADGPARFSANPMHYVRNHQSWSNQMTRVYTEFDRFQGLIMTGWSRYDHFSVLCELFPIALPALSMSAETILSGGGHQPMDGRGQQYKWTKEWLGCEPPQKPGFVAGCEFPGKRIYELINEFAEHIQLVRTYVSTDSEFNGWLSSVAEQYQFSSPMYLEHVLTKVDGFIQTIDQIERELREELAVHFYPDVANEFLLTYMSSELAQLRDKRHAAQTILQQQQQIAFPVRPFINSTSSRTIAGPANWLRQNDALAERGELRIDGGGWGKTIVAMIKT